MAGDKSFRVEASERLAHLESNQENLVERIEDLAEGQDEILDKLDEAVEERQLISQADDLDETDADLEELEEQVQKNAKKHARHEAALKLLVTAGSLAASGSAYVLYFA